MRNRSWLLLLCLALSLSCASTPEARAPHGEPQRIHARALPDGRHRLSLPPHSTVPIQLPLSVMEAREVLGAFHRAFPLADTARLRRLVASMGKADAIESTPADWEVRLREALKSLARDVCTPGSRLHRLVTKSQD